MSIIIKGEKLDFAQRQTEIEQLRNEIGETPAPPRKTFGLLTQIFKHVRDLLSNWTMESQANATGWVCSKNG